MKVLLIGSGGREHVLAWKIAQSSECEKLYVAPGNAGIAKLGECLSIKAEDIEELLKFVKENKIDLTVVGPELPLVNGLVNQFESEGLLVFGPTKEAAQLEGSKIFSKELMLESKVPTASSQVFSNVNDAKRYIIEQEPPIVIKADGLAAGKGVVIAHSCEEGIEAVNRMIAKRVFGDAGSRVLIEECLTGAELSVLVLTDGETVIPLASSQDHKRAFDQDEGPNTGGMGAYSPCSLVDDAKLEEIVRLTAQPIIQTLKKKGIIYRGVLYVGIMMTQKGPYVLEYNVRFGDPEAQAVLPRLKTDLLSILLQIAKGKLETKTLEWDSRACITVVIASQGYPGSYTTGFPILGLEEVASMGGVIPFHAGTKLNEEGKTVTAGGRVLSISALGATLRDAYEMAYCAVKRISFKNAFYRTDIGRQALATNFSIKNSRHS
ncbi:MAG: phosphoribosylamine--glycine ligase [Candidatus Omnitrophica bacterium]|nr:phosphoribosylamine--glycine ligase [Candidatus Omnitrophota bacterium]